MIDRTKHECRQRRAQAVTGASRGVGRGIAIGLAEAGMAVYVTGRSVARADLPAAIIRIPCDHTDDSQVAAAFARIAAQLAIDYGFTDIDGRRPRPLGPADV